MSKDKLSFLIVIWSILMAVTVGGAEPPKEDCIPFNPTNIEVKNVNGRWKIVEGNKWILDFGTKRREAQQAAQVIKYHEYTHQCFVGRPKSSMTYWKKVPSIQKPTTVFVVRHAEKGMTPMGNPPLTAKGENRAKTLAQILRQSGISAIYSTNYIRTQETVNNTSAKLGLPVKLYQSPSEIATRIKSQHIGKKVLIVGHSNTVPQILSALGVSAPPTIGEQFNNLFVVEISGAGPANLTHLKYEIFQNIKFLKIFPSRKLDHRQSK